MTLKDEYKINLLDLRIFLPWNELHCGITSHIKQMERFLQCWALLCHICKIFWTLHWALKWYTFSLFSSMIGDCLSYWNFDHGNAEADPDSMIRVCLVHFLLNKTLAEGWRSYTKEEPANKILYRIHNSVTALRRSKQSQESICQSSLTVVWGLLLETLISWYFQSPVQPGKTDYSGQRRPWQINTDKYS